jgi:hypothetical protein
LAGEGVVDEVRQDQEQHILVEGTKMVRGFAILVNAY